MGARVVRTSTVPDSTTDPSSAAAGKPSEAQLGEVIQLVKDYARQETLGPLKGWGRYLGFGVMGALVLGLGLSVVLLGLLRLLQTETHAFDGPNTSILAYACTLMACFVIIGLALWQIKRRTSLQREEPK